MMIVMILRKNDMKVYVVYGIFNVYQKVMGIFASMKSAEKFMQDNKDAAWWMHVVEQKVQGYGKEK